MALAVLPVVLSVESRLFKKVEAMPISPETTPLLDLV